MSDYISKLLLKIVLIFEMDGLRGVEEYARANRIPVDVCHKLLKEYGLLPRVDRSVAVVSRPS